jgi:chromosomal replication initiation ATPase DnaA
MNVPRFQRHPIDTSVYNTMMNRRKYVSYSADVIENIRQVVTEITGIDPYFEPNSRDKELVTARQYFMHFAYKKTSLTQKQIGLLLNKDHATIVHNNICVSRFLKNEPGYRNMYRLIDNKLNRIIKN